MSPTTKQKLAIEKMVGNGGNVTQAMIQAGYSPNTAHTPSKLTSSDAFKRFEEACQENGLNTDLIIQSLVEDIRGKPGARLQELALGSKLIGLFDKASSEQDIKFMIVPSDIAKRHNIKDGEVYKMTLLDRAMIEKRNIETPFESGRPIMGGITSENRERATKALQDIDE